MFRHPQAGQPSTRGALPLLVLTAVLLALVWLPLVVGAVPDPALKAGETVLILVLAALTFRRQRAVSRARDTLATALAEVPQALLTVDAGGTVRLITPRVAELLGLPPHLAQEGTRLQDILDWQIRAGEFAAPNAAEAAAAPPGLVPQARPDLMALAQRGDIAPGRIERLRRNGTALDIETRALPDGGAVRTFTDITDRCRAEAALAAAAQARDAELTALIMDLHAPITDLIATAGDLWDASLPARARPLVQSQRESLLTLAQAINTRLTRPAFDVSSLDPRAPAPQEPSPPEPPAPPPPAPAAPEPVLDANDVAARDGMAETLGAEEASGLLAAFAEEASDCITVLRGHEAARFWEARTAEAEGLTDTATSMGFHGLAALARRIAELPEGESGAALIEELDAALTALAPPPPPE